MKRLVTALGIGLIVTAAILMWGISYAEQGRHYEVTITNLTRGQIISPPVVIGHNNDFQLFRLGASASAELVALAEDGITDDLSDQLATLPSVGDFAVGSGPIIPGASLTLEITAGRPFKFISAAGMLITTNDAFFAIRGVRVPWSGQKVVEAEAYDAGSEANSESCDNIPGPPCGNPGVRDTEDAEGYVHVHAGIHGIGDLDSATHDWRNPVVEITIQRVHSDT